MKFWDRLTGANVRHAFDAANGQAARFAVDEDAIPAGLFGLSSYSNDPTTAPRVARTLAIQVPAVKRSRDLIAGVLGTLPLELVGPDGTRTTSELFRQPEPDVPRSVTFARTYEDMLFEGVAWWRVIEVGWHTYPTKVRRLDPRTVNVTKEGRVYVNRAGQAQGTAQEWVPDAELIRFDSPNDALLVAGARAIRAAAVLDAAAERFSDGAPPLDYFTPAENADPAEDDDIVQLLNDWQEARRLRSTGYVPAALKYNIAGWNPEQLQLAEARQHAVLEIARTAGVDPEDLGVSTTSRTYANQFDRRKQFTDFTQGGYRQAMEDRLSMGDVTPRGYVAKVNLSAFLLSDDKTRYEGYKIGLEVGAIDGTSEVRQLENKPPLTNAPADTQETDMAAAAILANNFDTSPEIRLDAAGAQAFEVDAEKRTVRGLLVPYGVPARSNGQLWQFSKGTLKYGDVSRVKLWIQHDAAQAVGVAFELDDRDDGLYGALRVARGADGDRALSLAEDGVLDGFSVGLGQGGRFSRKGEINHAIEAPLMEVSLTPAPSFDDARVHTVAASQTATQGEPMDNETQTDTVEAQDIAPDFSAVTDAIAAGFAAVQLPAREVIAAGGAFEINEPAPYRFDGIRGSHDFSTDLVTGLKGDSEAKSRVLKFMADAFAPAFNVTTTNTVEANYPANKPEMYVDQRRFATPFYTALYKGALDTITPFVFPKLNTYSGLVADHVEGTEPTAGAFDLTGQTVTPTAVSGKVVINREVWDQGGNPQVSRLIWSKMQYSYFQMLEAKAIALLDAASPTAIALTAGGADDDLVNELEGKLAELNFIAGGNVFDFAGTQIDLYKKLAAAVDSTGRKLLPIINPTNANGSASAGFRALDVAGTTFTPAPGLAATGSVVASSYLVDSESVHVWNSAPREITMDAIKVATVELGIWGYVAAAISDLTGVREITYDPVA